MAQWNLPSSPPSSPDPHGASPPKLESHSHPVPSLDSELAACTDGIGDTVFSKAWVLSLLVRAVEAVQSSPDMAVECEPETEGLGGDVIAQDEICGEACEEQRISDISFEQPQREETSTEVANKRAEEDSAEKGMPGGEREEEEEAISESLENDLCRLWDASMNSDVMVFLHQQHAVDLLLGVAQRTSAPRLTEICIGILGNMVCLEEVCLESFCSQEQIDRILSFLACGDSRILFETTRLIHTCLSHRNAEPVWLLEIKHSSNVIESLLFILQSSTNEDLLRSTAVLLDKLLDCDVELLTQWASKELVEALCEAAKQTRLSSFDATCIFVMTLQLLSTIDSGVPLLAECEKEVCDLLYDFLLSLEHLEGSLSTEQTSPIMAALSLLLTLMDTSSTGYSKKTLSDKDFQKFLHALLEQVAPDKDSQTQARLTQRPDVQKQNQHLDSYKGLETSRELKSPQRTSRVSDGPPSDHSNTALTETTSMHQLYSLVQKVLEHTAAYSTCSQDKED